MSGYPQPLAGSGGLGQYRLAEAFKHAFAARMGLGDPMDPFVQNNTAELADMLSPDFAALLRNATSDAHSMPPSAYGGRWNPLPGGGGYVPPDSGTTHLSVVDGQRNAVALTSTINTGFGSKVMSSSTGIILNNELDDFSSPGQPNAYNLAPSTANYILPGKRPLSSMSPTILLGADGRLRATLGASGGPRIITATVTVLLNLLSAGLDAGASVRAGRLHNQLLPDCVYAENTSAPNGQCVRVPASVEAALRSRGDNVTEWSNGAVVQLIEVDPDTGRLNAVSDTRKGGTPAGF
jgi:gamma-glutamyltranspeptidase/glutathione hydrolase/leukotriene-C4 hydrolase